MAIVFHCNHCGKKISAGKQAGGKWARCPACHNEIYVPAPVDGDFPDLKPLDPAEVKKKKELMAETFQLTEEIMGERDMENAPAESVASQEMSDEDLSECVIDYLRAIADSDLDRADGLMSNIEANGRKALKIIDRIAVSEVPESGLEDIPPQVLSGLIRELRASILS